MKTYSEYSDELLFSLVQNGDNAAFDILYERFFPLLYIHALRKLQDTQEAKDLVQDTFTILYQKRAEVGQLQNFSGYLYISLKNNILNFLEKKNVRSNYLENMDAQQAYSPVENYVFEKELQTQIEEGIDLLPEKMRLVFELSRYEHLSHKEIGEQLNISDKTVKRQIVNALKIIRSKINFLFF
ncbi:MAG: RNA polymerase sigma-70 factor [Sphingobacterium sp.]|jgi:RNA polymerase sigma-70 factor (ECF subfamily)|nr:RNA polymerase sigma-70 factor [Sphingobacterium sp.]